MFHTLDIILKSLLDDTSTPALVRNAEVAFDRPSESYNPDKTTINLFLYDVRENIESRNNEPIIERQNGIATIRRPPLRVSCSYLVTVWIEAGVTGEEAILKQHALLGEVLRVFSRWPSIPLPTPDAEGKEFLQGELKTSLYPISLVTAQTDLMRNPAEFWSALGGKLRPSFTVTATIAIDQAIKPVEASLVSTKKIVFGEKDSDEAEFKDENKTESVYEIGGVVIDKKTGIVLKGAEVTLIETGKLAITDQTGQYYFTGLNKGAYHLRAVKSNYSTATQEIGVPSNSSTAFDIKLSPT
ncbi:MAG TPA: Pvc16 family protein [Nitrospira sp.]|nr:Pvc16 family protein [Nitrosomonas sp.]HNC31870.1 Pvc16 family protein [Cyclobacteriaceae bacterium]HNE57936.1 Pvc16 family protein [Nitrosomonas sp.]HNI69412.1 Pvc16 family protein [Nitrospira sp.]HNJ91882.1 Pvc16 family protein [Nitrosomonas sp.]